MMPMIVAPDYQERVLFLGANGSGKTILASEMIAGYPVVVILDIKGDFPIPKSWGKEAYVILNSPTGLGWHRNRIIYRPDLLYRSSVHLSYFLVKMFVRARNEGKKRPFILYLDEGLYTAHKAKNGIADLAITGRSMGVGLWISSQRAKNLPVEARSEAWRWYVFYLPGLSDDMEVVEYSKNRITLNDLNQLNVDYSFWELSRSKGGRIAVQHYPPIKL